MGGFIVMLFCQLFLGMGAIGSQPKFEPETPAEYEFDKVSSHNLNWIRLQIVKLFLKIVFQVFGMHPVEKILVEETGVQTPEEAKPLLKKYWANKIADMSPEQIEKLKGKSKLFFLAKIKFQNFSPSTLETKIGGARAPISRL